MMFTYRGFVTEEESYFPNGARTVADYSHELSCLM